MTKTTEIIFYVTCVALFFTVGINAEHDTIPGMVPLEPERQKDQDGNNGAVNPPSKLEQEALEKQLNAFGEGPWKKLEGNFGRSMRKKRQAVTPGDKKEKIKLAKEHNMVDADYFQKAWEKQQEEVLLKEMENDVLRDQNEKREKIENMRKKWNEEDKDIKENERILAEEEKKQAELRHAIDADRFQKEYEKQQEAIMLKEMADNVQREQEEKKEKIADMKKKWKKEDKDMAEKARKIEEAVVLKEMEDNVQREQEEKEEKIENMKKEWKKEDKDMAKMAKKIKEEEERNYEKKFEERHKEWEELQDELMFKNAKKDLKKVKGSDEGKTKSKGTKKKEEKKTKSNTKNRLSGQKNDNWENKQADLWLRQMQEGDLQGVESELSKKINTLGGDSANPTDDSEENEEQAEKGTKVDKENKSKNKELKNKKGKSENESAREEKGKGKHNMHKTHHQPTEVSHSKKVKNHKNKNEVNSNDETGETNEGNEKVKTHFKPVVVPVPVPVPVEDEEAPGLAQEVHDKQKEILHQEEADLLRAKEAEEKMIREAREIARRIKAIEDEEEVLSRREERRIQEFKKERNKAENEMKHKEEERRRLNSERERRRKEDELEEEKLWMEDQERQLRELRRDERLHHEKHEDYLHSIKKLEDKRIKLLNMEAEMKTRRENARGEKVDEKFNARKKRPGKKDFTRTPIKLSGNHTETPVDIMNAIRGLVEELKENNDSVNGVKHLVGKTKSKLIFLKYKTDQNKTGDDRAQTDTPEQMSEWDELFSGIKPGNTTEADVAGDKILLTKAAEFFNDFKGQHVGTGYDQQDNANAQENSAGQSPSSTAGPEKEITTGN